MSPVFLIFTFIIVWFLVFLMVLPWGNRLSPSGSLGAAAGAPSHPRLTAKVLLTTLFSSLIVGALARLPSLF